MAGRSPAVFDRPCSCAKAIDARAEGRDLAVRMRNSAAFAVALVFFMVLAAVSVADVRYIYGDVGRLSQVIDDQGNVATYAYDSKFLRYWAPLEACGSSYERATEHLLAVDVPSTADIHLAYRQLEAGERAEVWGFEE